MKYMLRIIIFHIFALWITTEIIPTIDIKGSWQMMVLSGTTLGIMMLILKPMLKILFIPINILTFGLFSWFINVVVIYLLTILLPEVVIRPWIFPGAEWQGVVIPPISINTIGAFILTTVGITCITNILQSISEE